MQNAGNERVTGHKRGKTRNRCQARENLQRASSTGKLAQVKSRFFLSLYLIGLLDILTLIGSNTMRGLMNSFFYVRSSASSRTEGHVVSFEQTVRWNSNTWRGTGDEEQRE